MDRRKCTKFCNCRGLEPVRTFMLEDFEVLTFMLEDFGEDNMVFGATSISTHRISYPIFRWLLLLKSEGYMWKFEISSVVTCLIPMEKEEPLLERLLVLTRVHT